MFSTLASGVIYVVLLVEAYFNNEISTILDLFTKIVKIIFIFLMCLFLIIIRNFKITVISLKHEYNEDISIWRFLIMF